jgi:hypothetical protein
VLRIDSLFGVGALRYVIGHLQQQCDKWASRIFQFFLQQFDLGAILREIHASNAAKIEAAATMKPTSLPSTPTATTTAAAVGGGGGGASATSGNANARLDATPARLDPRDLTDLLEELALMSRCTEFYHRFIRVQAGYADSLLTALPPAPAAANGALTSPMSMPFVADNNIGNSSSSSSSSSSSRITNKIFPLSFSADAFLQGMLASGCRCG